MRCGNIVIFSVRDDVKTGCFRDFLWVAIVWLDVFYVVFCLKSCGLSLIFKYLFLLPGVMLAYV